MSGRHIIIAGGGVSGLSLAWLLKQRGHRVTVLEAQDRAGGTIKTEVVEAGGGRFHVEWGPNGFLLNKTSTLELVHGLGIQGDLLPASSSSKKRYLFYAGRLEALPASPAALLKTPLLSNRARLRLLEEPLANPAPDGTDESIWDFARRRLGIEIADNFIDPLVTGIHAGDATRISAAAAFPAIAGLEARGGLVKGGLAMAFDKLSAGRGKAPEAGGGVPKPEGRGLTSLNGGMEQLVATLAEQLGDAVKLGATIESVEPAGNGWKVHSTAGEVEGDGLVMALPAHVSANLLTPLDAELGRLCGEIEYVPVNVVALGFEERKLPRPLDGFGFLVPGSQKRQILGCLWSSSVYPGHRAPPGQVLMRVMVGGARRPELASLSDEETLRLVRAELGASLGSLPEATFAKVIRWPRAIPQYNVGHLARVRAIEAAATRHTGLTLTGNAFHGVGVNDCVAASQTLAARIA